MKKSIIFIFIIVFLLMLSVGNRDTSVVKEVDVKSNISEDEDKSTVTEVEKKIVTVEASKPIVTEESTIKKIICIDPGHQLEGDYSTEPIGPNSDIEKPKVSNGATGIDTKTPEYELTLEVSLKLRDRLEAEGFVVILTREIHDVNLSNSERAKIANKNASDIFIRIHADQRGSSEHNGISVLCPSKENKYTKEIYDDSNHLAHTILESLLSETGASDMGISYRDDISGFNWAEVPVVLVELGFMSNPIEDKKMSTEVYQNKLVDGMVEGILNYFNE